MHRAVVPRATGGEEEFGGSKLQYGTVEGRRLDRRALELLAVDRHRRWLLTAAAQARHALTVALKAPRLTAIGCDHNPLDGAQTRRIWLNSSAVNWRTGQSPLKSPGRACEAPSAVPAPSAPVTAKGGQLRTQAASQQRGARSTAAGGQPPGAPGHCGPGIGHPIYTIQPFPAIPRYPLPSSCLVSSSTNSQPARKSPSSRLSST